MLTADCKLKRWNEQSAFGYTDLCCRAHVEMVHQPRPALTGKYPSLLASEYKICCPVTNTVKFADIFHNHKLQLKTKQSSILETERHQQIYWETALKFPVEISLKESCWVSMHNNKSIPQRISIAVISVQSYF